MLFSTEAAAKTALAKLTKGMTVEAFEALATEVNGSFSKYENYVKGSMGVAAFDTWLYGDDVTIGSVTTEVITLEKDTSYAVAVYYADGDAEWFVNVKSAIFSENFTANAEALAAKYVITTKDKVINKIDG